MIFDGADIAAGDMVYDILFGAGEVEYVIEREGTFSVTFGTRQLTYKTNGAAHYPMKTLYWHDPISGFIPVKDEVRWRHFCELRNALSTVITKTTCLKKDGE